MPRRIEVPSADALFGGPSTPPPVAPQEAAAEAEAELEVRPLPSRPRRERRASPAARADQGTLRRLDEIEAALAELPIDRLIELREELETQLARGGVDPGGLQRLLELGRR